MPAAAGCARGKSLPVTTVMSSGARSPERRRASLTMRAATRRGPAAFAPGVRSLLVLDRRRARELAWIRFGPCPDARGPLCTAAEPPPVPPEPVMSDTRTGGGTRGRDGAAPDPQGPRTGFADVCPHRLEPVLP